MTDELIPLIDARFLVERRRATARLLPPNQKNLRLFRRLCGEEADAENVTQRIFKTGFKGEKIQVSSG